MNPTPSDVDRYTRHGWGTQQKFAGRVYGRDPIRQKYHDAELDRTLAKDDERRLAHTGLRLVPSSGPGAGSNRPPPAGPANPFGRAALFETLQHSKPVAPEEGDTWMGNMSYDPKLGRAVPPAPVTRGRVDLFDVVNHTGRRKPGDTSGDAWFGNPKVDPFLGKGSAAARKDGAGRKDLFATIQQAPRTSGDASRDSWLGHRLIDPAKGKSQGSLNPHVVGQEEHIEPVLAHAFLAEKVEHKVTSRAPKCEIGQVLTDAPTVAPPVNQGRRVLEQLPGKSGRRGLFGTLAMDNREVSEMEPAGRKHLHAPGLNGPGTGRVLLYWNGEK